ncbi:putative reverse transcriptase domain-containing protein [Tanacetum coccineum]
MGRNVTLDPDITTNGSKGVISGWESCGDAEYGFEPEEEFEEDPEEDHEEDPEEELKAEVEEDAPPAATLPVGSPITPPPLFKSSSDTEAAALIVANGALEMPPTGSTYEVGGPSSVSPFPPFYLHGREIARLDDNTELLLSNVKYLERCEKKRQAEMEANSSKIRKVKRRMDNFDRDLGHEVWFTRSVEGRVTELEDKDQEKTEEIEKMKKRLETFKTNYVSVEIMPPKMMKRKAVKKMVKKRIAKAIEEYERTKANPGNVSGSGSTNTGGTCAKEDNVLFAASTFEGRALTWWNGNVHTRGLVNANRILWTEFKSMMTTEYYPATKIQRIEEELWTLTLKGDDIEAYNNRFHKLALMCPDLVHNEKKKIERYIKGFLERIKGYITSSRPTTLHDAINLARELVEQAVQGKAVRVQGTSSTVSMSSKCSRCYKLGHREKDWVRIPATGGNALQDVTCFGYGEKGHYRHKCPKRSNQ